MAQVSRQRAAPSVQSPGMRHQESGSAIYHFSDSHTNLILAEHIGTRTTTLCNCKQSIEQWQPRNTTICRTIYSGCALVRSPLKTPVSRMTDRKHLTGNHSSLTIKHRSACNGGVQFSRDPLNLTNKHSKKVRHQPFPQLQTIQS